MEILIERKYKKENYTIGKLYINGEYFCDTLEDKDRGLSQDMALVELQELKEKNIKLQAELDRAQSNNEYLEKLARERLGLIKEGEQQVIPDNNSE